VSVRRINRRGPNGLFVAEQFSALPEDVIYVSESPIAEASKVFQLLGGASDFGAIPRGLGASY
jgi:hypothetical protein